MTQREIAAELGVSQPAVSQQLRAAPSLDAVHPEDLLRAAGPVLKQVSVERGFTELAVFGSVARGQARPDSDIDFLVQAPPETSIGDMVRFQMLIETILGRSIDLVSYGGLKPLVDDDIRQEAGDSLVMKIGEAANRLSRAGVVGPESIDWADAIANRNWLIHQYDEVDRQQTRVTLSRDLAAWRGSLNSAVVEAEAFLAMESEGD